MMQQVNLYKDIFKEGQKQNNLLLLTILLGTLSLSVIGFSVYREWDLHTLEKLAEQSRAQLDLVKTKVDQLVAQQPSADINAALVAEVADWQNTYTELMKTIQIMSPKAGESPAGFSKYFQALARESSPEVWLTNISISGSEQAITLEGSTFSPKAVPVVLQNLQKESVFAGKTFAKLVMLPSEQVPGQIDFKLSALPDAAENQVHVK